MLIATCRTCIALAVVATSIAAGAVPRSDGEAGAAGSASIIVLHGGTIVDGTGSPPRQADLEIRGDRIGAIGPKLANLAPPGTTVIDVSGLVVAPGFIEPHAHISAIDQQPDAENYLRQGVTTIVNSLHSLDQPAPLGRFLEQLHAAPNTVWTAGHTWARRRVMGLEDRAPTPGELRRMTGLVRAAMQDGAIGLGTGLEYVPAVYARTDEVLALARASALPGALYISHLRDEGARLLPALEEAIGIGRDSGLPVHIDHIKTTGRANWGQSLPALARIDAANAAGVRTTFDVYPYTAYSTTSDVLFPAWALADGPAAFPRRAADPLQRARLKSEMEKIYADQTGGELASVQFRDQPAGFAGRTLADYVLANDGSATLSAGLDALIELQGTGGFTANFDAMDERDVEAFLRHPQSCISADGDLVRFGEGRPHPRSYGAFPRVIARYVRERRVLTLETAIRKMTGMPAAILGLVDRGLLRSGYRADVVVFDPEQIADTATFAVPHQYAVGIRQVLVNGQFVVKNGAPTGGRPGRALRRGGDGGVR
jgi:N-acyl-D-amino-acid deacylase